VARIMFVWELGAGLGHVLPHRPVLEQLIKMGHEVFLALRDVTRAGVALKGVDVRLLPAPFKNSRTLKPIEQTLGFAHILHNIGFGDAGDLSSLFDAWRTLYALVQPDLVVADHSPTALLALRDLPIRRAIIGTGFLCPPDTFPLAPFPAATAGEDVLMRDEELMLAGINHLLSNHRCQSLVRLGELYGQVDATFLTTYPELDHFGERENVQYWGTWSSGVGIAPQWPLAPGSKVYAYLKPFENLSRLLELLSKSELPTIVYVDGIDPKTQERFKCKTMRFESQPLEIDQAARECQLAILNTNHGTMCSLLLAGKPSLMIPLQMEQQMLTCRFEATGAGKSVRPTNGPGMIRALQDMLSSARYGHHARHFASKHAMPRVEDRVNGLSQAIAQVAICKSSQRIVSPDVPASDQIRDSTQPTTGQ
jgi:hypothetical protein